MIKLTVPHFATEKEEACWWDDHMDIVEKNLIEAMKNGTAQKGTAERLMREARAREKVTLAAADLELAQKLSEKKKLDYETFVRNLFHRAVAREHAAIKRTTRRKSA